MPAPAPDAGNLFPRVAPLFAAMFLGFLTVGLPLPALPLHVTRVLGYGTAIAGLVVGVQSLATLLTRAHSGRMVDALGSKATLVRGLAVCSGAGWLYLLSATMATRWVSLAVLLLGRVTLGIGESLLITGVVSWGMARAGPGRAGAAMSWNGMAQYGSLAAGAQASDPDASTALLGCDGLTLQRKPPAECATVAFNWLHATNVGRPRRIESVAKPEFLGEAA